MAPVIQPRLRSIAKMEEKEDSVTIEATVDRLGRVRSELDALAGEEKELRDRLLAVGAAEIDGSVYRASISTSIRWSLDTGAAKTALGQEWVDAHSRQSIVRSVKLAPRADVLANLAEAA